MTLLLLVRHGHTDVAGKRLTGWTPGVHLNERGRDAAEALVGRLEEVPIDAIYSSPLERCRETAAPLARARGLSVRIRRGLIETGYGDWTGRTISQLRRTKLWRTVERTPSAVRFPGGESLLEVQARAVEEVRRIAADHPTGTVVVVSHADPIRLLIAHVGGAHVDHLHRLVVDTASVTAVALDHETPRLLKVNDTGGLTSLAGRGPRHRPPTAKVRG
jgi:probable phosphomutase (TIGR03848 family)